MVKAGFATDATIQELLPHLDKGDILIDGGNTFFKDTVRRNEELANSESTLSVRVLWWGRRRLERSFDHAWWSKRSI